MKRRFAIGMLTITAGLALSAGHAVNRGAGSEQTAPSSQVIDISLLPEAQRADALSTPGSRIWVPPGTWTLAPVKSDADGLLIEGPGELLVRAEHRSAQDTTQAAIELTGAGCSVNTTINADGGYYAALRLRDSSRVGGQWARMLEYTHKGVTVNHEGHPIDSISIDDLYCATSVVGFAQVGVQIDPRTYPVRLATVWNLRVGEQAGDRFGPLALKLATCDMAIVEGVQDLAPRTSPDREPSTRVSIYLAENLGHVSIRQCSITGISHQPEPGLGDSLLKSLTVEQNTFIAGGSKQAVHHWCEARVLRWRDNVVEEPKTNSLLYARWHDEQYDRLIQWEISGNDFPGLNAGVPMIRPFASFPLGSIELRANRSRSAGPKQPSPGAP